MDNLTGRYVKKRIQPVYAILWGKVKDILTVSEAASFLHKYPGTIRHWIKTKKLKARRISAGGSGVYVLLRTDLLEFMVSEQIRKESVKITRKKAAVKPSSQEQFPI